MPQQLGAPGVYIEEIPSGRRVIKSVSTNIAAFIDYFTEGPMDEAVQIFGTADFDRIFGGYNTLSEASYAIPQFFLNGGTAAYVIRVADASDATNPLGKPVHIMAGQNAQGRVAATFRQALTDLRGRGAHQYDRATRFAHGTGRRSSRLRAGLTGR